MLGARASESRNEGVVMRRWVRVGHSRGHLHFICDAVTESDGSLPHSGPHFRAPLAHDPVILCQSRERNVARGFGLYWSW